MKLIIATTVLALSAGAAVAQDADIDMPELTKPEVAFLDAAAAVSAATTGDLVAMELDYIDETAPVYIADIESDTAYARLMIDGLSGEILVSETIEAQNEDALAAYLELFSTHAEFAEMLEFSDMIEGEFDDMDMLDMCEGDIEAFEEMLDLLGDDDLFAEPVTD